MTYSELEMNYLLAYMVIKLNKYSKFRFPKSKITDLLAENYNIAHGPSLGYVFRSEDSKREAVEENKKDSFCTFYRKDRSKAREKPDEAVMKKIIKIRSKSSVRFDTFQIIDLQFFK